MLINGCCSKQCWIDSHGPLVFPHGSIDRGVPAPPRLIMSMVMTTTDGRRRGALPVSPFLASGSHAGQKARAGGARIPRSTSHPQPWHRSRATYHDFAPTLCSTGFACPRASVETAVRGVRSRSSCVDCSAVTEEAASRIRSSSSIIGRSGDPASQQRRAGGPTRPDTGSRIGVALAAAGAAIAAEP